MSDGLKDVWVDFFYDIENGNSKKAITDMFSQELIKDLEEIKRNIVSLDTKDAIKHLDMLIEVHK